MKTTFLSHFTPSLMSPEALEAIFVQREDLAKRLVELIRESAFTASKHHALFIGPRGIGKTHLIALVYHRIVAMEDLRDRLVVAWLREEEWGVTSFLDLLLRIFRALPEQSDEFEKRIESLYGLPADAAEGAGANLLKEIAGDRTLLLLVENLDDLFNGLGDEGQKRLRAYFQENPFCAILATAQSLFGGVSLQTSPFYGFFRLHHLEGLGIEAATSLLTNIAQLQGDNDLASFIRTPTGRARIRAIHHLAGGNHRVYVIFSQFITRESLDELVDPFLHTLDELTPYYQARMAWLSPQQRKIVEFLIERKGAVPVKEIAQRCFMTHQTATGQLKTLRGMGYIYVEAEAIGRESYYEIQEPLMRICLEVKKQRGGPIRLIVDFLRLWHTRPELQQRLELIQPEAALEREYLVHALLEIDTESQDPLVAACLKDYETYVETGDFIRALEAAEELVALRGNAYDWHIQGYCLSTLKSYDKALICFSRSTELDSNNESAWINRGVALGGLGNHIEALSSFDRAIELNSDSALAWGYRGWALDNLKRYEEALESYDRAIQIDPTSAEAWSGQGNTHLELGNYDRALVLLDKATTLNPKLASAWGNQGLALAYLKRYEDALAMFDKALELSPHNEIVLNNRFLALYNLGKYEEALITLNKAIGFDPNLSEAWGNRGLILNHLARHKEAIEAFDKAIELKLVDGSVWNGRGAAFGNLGRHREALESFDRAIELDPKNKLIWDNRGKALSRLGCHGEALTSFNRIIGLDPKDASAWSSRSAALGYLGRYDEALVSCEKAIELGEQDESNSFNRAEFLLALDRWDEGIVALEDTLTRFGQMEKQSTGDTGAIVTNLITGTRNPATLRSRVQSLTEVFDRHNALSTLGTGIVRSIPALYTKAVSDEAARTWRDVWQELAGNREEFQIPLRLLDAAVRYRETQDRRILLALPVEERKVLEELLEERAEGMKDG